MPQIKDIAILKNVAEDDDLLVMQNPTTGETYKITKADLLAGLATDTAQSASTTSTFLTWLLTETSGVLAKDSSSGSRNGLYVNTTLNDSGVTLDGNGRIVSSLKLTAFNSFAVGLEFKTNTVSNQGLWEFRNSQDLSGGQYAPGLTMSSGQLNVYGYPSSSGYSSQSFNDNNWHKCITVLSTSNMKLYVDKTKILDVNGNPIQNFDGYFSVGATRSNGNFVGQLRNFRVWEYALSESECISYS
ncbi:hypothetical protein NIES4106_53540 [Fischerella sp. NIES-4106]|nr:hypothetical protein NIES4106_53540 [Fischerella sp. NIES-4106]